MCSLTLSGGVMLGVLASSEGAGHPTVETRAVQLQSSATGGYGALEMWLVQLATRCQGKCNTCQILMTQQEKNANYLTNTFSY